MFLDLRFDKRVHSAVNLGRLLSATLIAQGSSSGPNQTLGTLLDVGSAQIAAIGRRRDRADFTNGRYATLSAPCLLLIG